MTPEQIRLVQQNVIDLEPRILEVGASFYDHLFAANPELRALFSTEPAVQQVKFTDELREIVAAISNLDTFVDHARELGVKHLDHGTKARHYGPVGDALIAALAEVTGPTFTPELRDAWTVAYNLVAETMQQGAAAHR